MPPYENKIRIYIITFYLYFELVICYQILDIEICRAKWHNLNVIQAMIMPLCPEDLHMVLELIYITNIFIVKNFVK